MRTVRFREPGWRGLSRFLGCFPWIGPAEQRTTPGPRETDERKKLLQNHICSNFGFCACAEVSGTVRRKQVYFWSDASSNRQRLLLTKTALCYGNAENFLFRERIMKKHAFLGPGYSTDGRAQRQTAYSVAGMLSIGLTGVLLLGGCNKTPAPAAPAAEPSPTAQAAPAPAPAPDAAAAPAGPRCRSCSKRTATTASRLRLPPPPPPPQKYVVPAGTQLVVRMGQTLSAKNNNVGDTFTGALAQSLVVHGVKVIKAGAPVTGTVVAAKGQGRFKGAGDLGIAITRVGSYSVATTSYEATAKGKGKRTAGFVGGGAGGGALIGGLAGGGKGALIGGLLGAGAGTAGAAFTGNKDISIPAESVVTFNLSEPITVVIESPTQECK